MNEPLRRIVAGISEVQERDPLLASAVALAESAGVALHLVHAFAPPDPELSPSGSTSDELERHRRELRDGLQKQLESIEAEQRIICHVLPGSAADVILDVAQGTEAGLVVVGATQRTSLSNAMLGTTAQRVLRASPVTVLVSRGREPPRRVLLATDLSRISSAVHERGLALLDVLWRLREVEIRSLFVAGDDVLLPSAVQQVAMREQAEARLSAFLQRVEERNGAIQARVRLGLSAREILAEVEEWNADLLILGTHGRTGASRFLIGSVAETAMGKARCDLLLIPTRALGSAMTGGELFA